MCADLRDFAAQQSRLARRYTIDNRAVQRIEMQLIHRREIEFRPVDDTVLRRFDCRATRHRRKASLINGDIPLRKCAARRHRPRRTRKRRRNQCRKYPHAQHLLFHRIQLLFPT